MHGIHSKEMPEKTRKNAGVTRRGFVGAVAGTALAAATSCASGEPADNYDEIAMMIDQLLEVSARIDALHRQLDAAHQTVGYFSPVKLNSIAEEPADYPENVHEHVFSDVGFIRKFFLLHRGVIMDGPTGWGVVYERSGRDEARAIEAFDAQHDREKEFDSSEWKRSFDSALKALFREENQLRWNICEIACLSARDVHAKIAFAEIGFDDGADMSAEYALMLASMRLAPL